jgi:hypothetical protein
VTVTLHVFVPVSASMQCRYWFVYLINHNSLHCRYSYKHDVVSASCTVQQVRQGWLGLGAQGKHSQHSVSPPLPLG